MRILSDIVASQSSKKNKKNRKTKKNSTGDNKWNRKGRRDISTDWINHDKSDDEGTCRKEENKRKNADKNSTCLL